MKRRDAWIRRCLLLGVEIACVTLTIQANSQVQTETTSTTGQSTKEVKVERAQVVYVNGNDLVVKMEDGTIRHFPNVPDSARVTVDGKELGIHDLRNGMTLQRTITTTTTPKVITTTQNVTGTVWNIQPPNTITLRLEDGTNQIFKIPKNQKFNVDGQMTDAWGLRKGMRVTATKVVEEPITQVEQARKLTGQMPPPPAPPPADVPILVVLAVPRTPQAPQTTAASAEATPPPTVLPKTGSGLPFIGALGFLSLLSGFGIRGLRKNM